MSVCQIGPYINPSNIHFCANISFINSEWTFKTGPEDQNHCNSWTGENILRWFSFIGNKFIIIKTSEVNLNNIMVLFSSVSSHFVKIKRMQFWNKNPKYALIVSQPYEETRTKRFAAEEKRGTSILSVCNILCEDFPKGTSILSSKWSPTVIHLSRLIIRTFVCVFVSVSENKIYRTCVTSRLFTTMFLRPTCFRF